MGNCTELNIYLTIQPYKMSLKPYSALFLGHPVALCSPSPFPSLDEDEDMTLRKFDEYNKYR